MELVRWLVGWLVRAVLEKPTIKMATGHAPKHGVFNFNTQDGKI